MNKSYSTVPAYLPNSLPPMKPGIYTALDPAIYHRCFAASQSLLKLMEDKSPAHVLHRMQHPTDPTAAMAFGTKVHAAVLEPVRFARCYSAALQCGAKTQKGAQCSKGGSVRVGGVWYCGTHQPENAEPDPVEAVTADELETIECMRTRLLSGEYTGPLLTAAPADTEVSIFWEDEETGVPCKARLDRVVWSASMVVDLKTCCSARPHDFDRDICTYNYHYQAAHNLHGLAKVGRPVEKFLLVPVEKEPPYETGVVEIAAPMVAEGHRRVTELLATWRECVASGLWPGYGDVPRQFYELPKWKTGEEKDVVLA